MTARVTTGLRVVSEVAARRDPTAPIAVGAIAADLGIAVSSASRLCAELAEAGMLDPAGSYGAYRLGRRAIRLSGAAAKPVARAVRVALTRVAQETGETVGLAAGPPGDATIVAAVDSAWTLHAPAHVGERAAAGSALAGGSGTDRSDGTRPWTRTTSGKCVEVALPVRDGSGDTVAVLGVRLPVYRAARGVPQAGAALLRARPALERAAAAVSGSPRPLPRDPDPSPRTPPPRSLAAAFRMLEHLADGPDGAAGIAAAAGLRIDRTRRLLESCLRSGLVEQSDGGVEFRLSWLVHGWHRAAAHPALLADGRRYAAETAAVTGACVFLTVLKGLRSVTLVEELAVLGEGLVMRPWLGRPHPIIGSDGGPTLVMDLSAEELSEIFPAQHRGPEFDRLLDRVARVTRDQVISVESVEEFGITSVSAPVRDAAGAVVAAACIVGATEHVRPRRAEIEAEAQRLASRATALLV